MKVDQIETNRWNRSLRTSIIVHIFILLLSWLFRLQDDPTQDIDTQYAVTVSFQTVDFRNSVSSNSTRSSANEGRQRPEAQTPEKLESSKAEEIKVPTPAPPTPSPVPPQEEPTPTEPVLSETTVEESDIQAVEEEIDVEDPEPEYIPEEVPDPVPSEEPIILNPDLPSIEDIIGDINDDPIEMEEETNFPAEGNGDDQSDSDTSGSSSDAPSQSDGDSGNPGKGDEGSGRGNDRSGNDNDSGIGSGKNGEGEFDASGDGIFGRKVIKHPYADLMKVTAKSGRIGIKTCINQMGTVTYVEIDEKFTTISDFPTLHQALEAARKYVFETDFTAPGEQCGLIKILIDNFRGIR